jgi:hypothetical protein
LLLTCPHIGAMTAITHVCKVGEGVAALTWREHAHVDEHGA